MHICQHWVIHFLCFILQTADTGSLTLTCPSDYTVYMNGTSGPVTFSGFTSTGITMDPKCEPESGTVFNLGTTTVGCAVSDGIDYTAGCSFLITVQGRKTKYIVTCTHYCVKLE